MTKQLFLFQPSDRYSGKALGPERYVLISEYDGGRRVVDLHGSAQDEQFQQYVAKVTEDEATAPVRIIHRAPTATEFGTRDEFAYHYLRAVGRPATTFTEFFDIDRAWTLDMSHVLRVVEFATEVGALDSLYRSLSNLACNPDEVPLFSYDSPRSLFWHMMSKHEHLEAKRKQVLNPRDGYIIPRKESGRYHGGLIAHQSSKDGSWEYAVHT